MFTNLACLYPDVADTEWHKVILKVDSGPGQMNIKLLAKLRAQCYYLYPGVPNTIAVIQETDQLFGELKSKFWANLNRLVDERLAQGKTPVSFKPEIVGQLVFGKADPSTKSSNYNNAYVIIFLLEKNIAVWATVGATPLTRKCLESDKVNHNSEFNPKQVQYKEIEKTNHNACHLLIARGYKGDKLKVVLKKEKKKTNWIVTVPNFLEEVQALADSKLYSIKFIQTWADHLCTDMLFKAAELQKYQQEREKC